MSITRRDLLRTAAVAPAATVLSRDGGWLARLGGAGAATPIDPTPPEGWSYPAAQELLPFGHGVASGDPLADRVIIWTRITIPDPRGWQVTDPQGVTSCDVAFAMATDPEMTDVVAQGLVQTSADRDWTVKIDVDRLDAGTTYFFCFEALGWRSPIGRTRTAPAADGPQPESLHLAHVACTSWWHDHFSAYARIGERDDLDLVIHVGDHMYEASNGHPAVRAFGDDFDRDGLDAGRWRTRDQARRRYALYYHSPNLMSAHLAAPWVIAVDNHDFADLPDEPAVLGLDPESPEGEDVRRYGGAEVFWEWTATRPIAPDHTGRPRFEVDADYRTGWNAQVPTPRGAEAWFTHREIRWGSMLSLIAIDWQYSRRLLTDEHEAAVAADIPEAYTPVPRMLGATQWRWLMDTIEGTRDVTHRVLLNQKNMGQLGSFNLPTELRDAARELGLTGVENAEDVVDIYPGWTTDRRVLYRFLRDIGIHNTIVLSGDSHGWWAYDCVEDSTAPDYNPVDPWNLPGGLTPVGVELVVGMGRPGLVDVAAELAYEAAGGGEQFAGGASPEYQALRSAVIPASLAAEGAAMAANPNMRYMNWREYGHTMVHLYARESVLELLASEKTADVGPGQTGPLGTPADTVLARFRNDVARPTLRPLLLTERTRGAAKPSVPTPRTTRLAAGRS